MIETDTAARAPLTDTQAAVLATIAEYVAEHGYPPALEDIRAAHGWAHESTARFHVSALERKGCVARRPSAQRSIRVTDIGHAALSAANG